MAASLPDAQANSRFALRATAPWRRCAPTLTRPGRQARIIREIWCGLTMRSPRRDDLPNRLAMAGRGGRKPPARRVGNAFVSRFPTASLNLNLSLWRQRFDDLAVPHLTFTACTNHTVEFAAERHQVADLAIHVV